jgi:hypothetical protein
MLLRAMSKSTFSCCFGALAGAAPRAAKS